MLRVSLLSVVLVAASTFCALAASQPVPSGGSGDGELQMLARADQDDRKAGPGQNLQPSLSQRDAARRGRVRELLAEGQVRSASDYFSAALILQHGTTSDDARLANALAVISNQLQPGDPKTVWLIAASWDRMMMHLKKPQWYGTQFVRTASGKWELYDIDENAVTDSLRASMGVTSVKDSKSRAAKMNEFPR